MIELAADYRHFLLALHDADAVFLVVGNHAIAFHEHEPRVPRELEVLVRPDYENAERVLRALIAFGAPVTSLGLTAKDLTHEDQVFQVGQPGTPIDVLTSIYGLTFEEASDAHVFFELEGASIPVFGYDALVQSKLALAGPQDLADVVALRVGRDF